MMKEAVLVENGKIEIRETKDPKIEADDQVLLEVEAIGVCGSDVHYYKTGRIGSQIVNYPFRLGHEFSGRVLETGEKAGMFSPGDLVAIDPAISCMKCDQCLSGRPHTCRNIIFLGCPGQAQGCLCERIVMPARCCFKVGPALTIDQAALCEPLSIGLYAVRKSVPMNKSKIAILGCGPIGLSVLMFSTAYGARVYATDKINNRLAAAKSAGAFWVGNPESEDVVKAMLDSEPFQFDAVFECCGDQAAVDQALAILKPGGKLMFIGIPESDRIYFSMDLMRRKEILVQNVRRQNECVAPAIDAVSSGTISPDSIVTHRFGLEETDEAFKLVSKYADGVIKAMIYPRTKPK